MPIDWEYAALPDDTKISNFLDYKIINLFRICQYTVGDPVYWE